MPELPEVTTVTNQLKKEIVGQTIADVVSINGYKTTPEFNEFRNRSKGLKVLSVERVAKTIVVGLGEPSPNTLHLEPVYLVIHLAMTGRLLLRSAGSQPDPWLRMFFKLEGPSGESGIRNYELRFTDPRMFGYVKLVSDLELKEHRAKYGPDPLEEDLTPAAFLNRLRLKKTMVKKALLEQGLIAGVGNIYANDSLWRAQIHPETPTSQVTSTQAKDLLEALRQILAESIEHRGSTLADKMYVDLYGREGEHQNYFRVYGKMGKNCPKCSSPLEYLEIGGRASFFCPSCQVKTKTGSGKSLATYCYTMGVST